MKYSTRPRLSQDNLKLIPDSTSHNIDLTSQTPVYHVPLRETERGKLIYDSSLISILYEDCVKKAREDRIRFPMLPPIKGIGKVKLVQYRDQENL